MIVDVIVQANVGLSKLVISRIRQAGHTRLDDEEDTTDEDSVHDETVRDTEAKGHPVSHIATPTLCLTGTVGRESLT